MKKHNLTWISAVAAMLAAGGPGARAQDAPAPPAPPMPPMSGTDTTTTTTTTDTTTSTSSTGTMSGGMSNNMGGMSSSMDSPSMRQPSSDYPDYSVLITPEMDYQDLKQAEAVGLGDDNIARISLISRLTTVPFRTIRDAVLRGDTFYELVDKYSMNLADLDDMSDEKLRISAFESAYEASGKNSARHLGSNQDVELEAHFARFRELNASFPATATPSTLVFEHGPAPVQPFAQTTDTTVRATRVAPVETVEVAAPPTVVRVRTVTHVSTVKRVRVYRPHAVRHHVMRRHQVHHHMPRYMHRGS